MRKRTERKRVERKRVERKRTERKRVERKRTERKRVEKKKIKDARMIPKEKYQELLKKKRLTKQEKKILDKALFLNYCKCVKSIKYSRKNERGAEYPICMSSIYLKRGKVAPKGIAEECKKYL